MRVRELSVSVVVFAAAPAVGLAQTPLAPTSNVVIATGGVLHFSSIHIPPGVGVTFSGSAAAIVRVDGDVNIDGWVRVQGSGHGPAVGNDGFQCIGTSLSSSGTSGSHAGVYGSAMPFTLEGGSAGGGLSTWGSPPSLFNPCTEYQGYVPGARGGGTLVIAARGNITVRGTINADGAVGTGLGIAVGTGSGSGGSILLASARRVSIGASGQVTARLQITTYAPSQGYIRFDSLGGPPVVVGTVFPAPLLVELPHLRAPQPASIGTQWPVEARAPAGDAVLVAVAFAPIGPLPTQCGLLGIDPGTSVTLGIVSMPSTVVDPAATVTMPIPNVAALVGTPFWVQGVDFVVPGSPRLTNVLAAVVEQ